MSNVFEVTIQETLERKIKVEASSWEEAEEMVQKGWKDGDFVLSADDFTGVEFNARRISERKRSYER